MPYINQVMRAALSLTLNPLYESIRRNPKIGAGDLNYIVTKLVLAWLGKEPKYADYNAAIGVLECAKQELYRRAVVPYEQDKQAENGDVYND